MGIFCLLYQNKLAALASGELPEILAKRVEQHLSACPNCLSEWTAQQRFTQTLRGAAPAPLPASPYLWERLEAAIREDAPSPATTTRPLHRLAPLGALALAGAAMATVFVGRPHSTAGTLPASLPVGRDSSSRVALATPTRPSASPAPKPATALDLARQVETSPVVNKPARDPFSATETRARAETQESNRNLPNSDQLAERLRIARALRRPPLPHPNRGGFPQDTQTRAIAQLEQGTLHIQTAEFNREVTEAEEHAHGPVSRVNCTPTEAIASARGEVNLGIFQ